MSFDEIVLSKEEMELLKILVPFAVPIPFSCYFEIFDALLQAYVFVFLTSIYLSEAVEE